MMLGITSHLSQLNPPPLQQNDILGTPCRSHQERWKDADDSIPSSEVWVGFRGDSGLISRFFLGSLRSFLSLEPQKNASTMEHELT